MRCKVFFVVSFAVLFLSIGIVSAGFEVGNVSQSFNAKYKPSENLAGWVNISFLNESINSSFEDSFGNTISLEDILNLNSNYNYTFNDSTNATVNSSFQKLFFSSANFTLPNNPGSYNYSFNFSGAEIFFMNVSVKNVTLENQARENLDAISDRLNKINFDLTDYNLFERRVISKYLDLEFIENKVSELEINFSSASNDSDYEFILGELSEIELPGKIEVLSEAEGITFYAENDNIDLGVLGEISGSEYDSSKRNEYLDGIFLWNQENLETKVSYKIIALEYGNSSEQAMNFFEFSFKDNPKGAYFVVEDLEDLEFKQSYSEKSLPGYKYIELQSPLGVSFSTTENYDFSDVPVFISPSLDELPKVEVGEYIDSTKEVKISRWALFALVIALLLVFGMALYHILQTWYKRRYENYLFKNRNDLYNLIIYINEAKKKGMDKDKIKKSLKKSGWKGEQIDYVLKKYAGKRTGLPELNLFGKKNK